MTGFSAIKIGRAGGPYDKTQRPSLDNNLRGVPGGYAEFAEPGAPLAPSQFYSVVPLVKVANNIALSQTPAAAGNLTLTAGTGVNAAVLTNGGVNAAVLQLDCARCISVTGVGGTVAQAVTVIGYDDWEQLVTQTFTGPAGATTTTSLKALRYIQSISIAGGTTSAITVGTSDVLGLPYRVDAWEYTGMAYNGAAIAANTGFVGAVSTSPATKATGDVRGTYALQSASDGTKRFAAEIQLVATDSVDQVWGVAQSTT